MVVLNYEQACTNCDETFEFTTEMTFSYNVYCTEEKHHMIKTKLEELWECEHCDYYDLRGNVK